MPVRLVIRKNAAVGRWLLLSKFQPACMNADMMTRIIASVDMFVKVAFQLLKYKTCKNRSINFPSFTTLVMIIFYYVLRIKGIKEESK